MVENSSRCYGDELWHITEKGLTKVRTKGGCLYLISFHPVFLSSICFPFKTRKPPGCSCVCVWESEWVSHWYVYVCWTLKILLTIMHLRCDYSMLNAMLWNFPPQHTLIPCLSLPCQAVSPHPVNPFFPSPCQLSIFSSPYHLYPVKLPFLPSPCQLSIIPSPCHCILYHITLPSLPI